MLAIKTFFNCLRWWFVWLGCVKIFWFMLIAYSSHHSRSSGQVSVVLALILLIWRALRPTPDFGDFSCLDRTQWSMWLSCWIYSLPWCPTHTQWLTWVNLWILFMCYVSVNVDGNIGNVLLFHEMKVFNSSC